MMTKKDIDQIQHEKRTTRCRHFNGMFNKTCDAGVSYDEIRKLGSLPCLPWHVRPGEPAAKCVKYATHTKEEIEKQEQEIATHMQKMKMVMEAIAPFRKRVRETGKSHSGIIDCPACGEPQGLRFGISSYNGHARGKCNKCGVGWME